MPRFFSNFPRRAYDTNNDSVLRVVTDIFRNVDVNDSLFDTDASAYSFTQIQDGERPDVLSYRLYGTDEHYWSFFILNDQLKEGLNHSWPLSSSELENSLQRYYDPYAVLTFLPFYSGALPLISVGNTLSGVILDDMYLPWLRLETVSVIPGAVSKTARIEKWDDTRLQLWITDLDGDMSADLTFKLSWLNPYEEDSDEWIANEQLKTEWMDAMLVILADSDPAGYASYVAIIADFAASPELHPGFTEDYVLGKIYSRGQFWSSARNAASYYYSAEDDTDVITALDANGSSNYVSFAEEEVALNDSKARIRVVNKDSIGAFSTEYFSVLNR